MAEIAKTTGLQKWSRGQRITAARLDEPRRAIQSLLDGGLMPRQVYPDGVRHRVAELVITAVNGDTLTCGDVEVTKPPLLRNSVASRSVWSYSYTGTDARTATDTGTFETEDQVVVPGYLVGDTIYAVSVPRGADGIAWLDLNVDGRAWAEAAA